MKNKTCTKCLETKPIEAFELQPGRSGKLYRRNYCRRCKSQRNTFLIMTNHDRYTQFKRSLSKFRKANPEIDRLNSILYWHTKTKNSAEWSTDQIRIVAIRRLLSLEEKKIITKSISNKFYKQVKVNSSKTEIIRVARIIFSLPKLPGGLNATRS